MTIEGVGINPTRTGLLDVLRAMGADRIAVENERQQGGEPVADLVVRGPRPAARLRGTTVQGDTVVRMIDEFPILAVAATQAAGADRGARRGGAARQRDGPHRDRGRRN